MKSRLHNAPGLKKLFVYRWKIFASVSAAAVILFFLFHAFKNNSDTVSPIRGPIIESVYGIGTVTSENTYKLRIGVMSAVDKIFVHEGASVKAGDPLIQLIGLPVFRAPFAGTVTSLPFIAGETVFPQVPILILTDTENRYIKVTLEQEGALRIRKNQNVRLSFESIRGIKFSGKVAYIYPDEGQFVVNIDVENLPPEILPGMTADIAVEVAKRENALLIPLSSINNGRAVIQRNGKKMKVELKIGGIDGEWAEVLSGDIHENDSIIIGKK